MPVRVTAWDGALVRWAERQRGRPWTWGETDCCSLVRGALMAMYGEDLVPELPPWTDRPTAIAILRDTGGAARWLRERLEATRVDVHHLQQGDVVIGPPGPHDYADSAFVVVSGRLLSCNPGETVTLWPLEELPPRAYGLRIPHSVREPAPA